MLTITPHTLTALRKSRGWTQKQLAEASGVSLRQIVVLESERTDGGAHPVREATLDKLANALGVTGDVLREEGFTMHSDNVHVAVSMSASRKLSYDLINHVFGIDRDELIDMAPMLLMIAFEESLHWRQRMLTKARAALGQWETTGRWAEPDMGMERLHPRLEQEQADIERRDLFSPSWERDGLTSNRFRDFLEDCCSRIPRDRIEMIGLRKVDFGAGLPGISLPYNVCRKVVYDLCGRPDEPNSRRALYALLTNSVRIADIPERMIGSDARAERISWLAGHVDDPEDGHLVDCFPSYQPTTEYAATHSSTMKEHAEEERDQ